MQITENEQTIIEFLRSAKPYEVITIRKDKQGLYDKFIVNREQQIILSK